MDRRLPERRWPSSRHEESRRLRYVLSPMHRCSGSAGELGRLPRLSPRAKAVETHFPVFRSQRHAVVKGDLRRLRQSAVSCIIGDGVPGF
jgi:hypothetical protein